MNFGGNIAFLRKNISGAPFTAGAADNGLSVDPNTGKIVLGNDVGDTLAALLSNREIPMEDFFIRLLGLTKQDGQLILSAGNIDTAITETKMNVEGATTTRRKVTVLTGPGTVAVSDTNHNWHVFVAEGTIE